MLTHLCPFIAEALSGPSTEVGPGRLPHKGSFQTTLGWKMADLGVSWKVVRPGLLQAEKDLIAITQVHTDADRLRTLPTAVATSWGAAV